MSAGRCFTAVDVFAGCGGCTVGLKRAGFRVAGAVELNGEAASVYGANHPDVRLWERAVERLSVAEILRDLEIERGELDLLAGCPPCQGFSAVRTLNGAREIPDERNDLIFEFQRLVRGLKPKAVMLENVPGLATDSRMQKFQASLEGMGFHTTCSVLNAAEYGVPQRRRRLILLAGRFGPIRLARRARVRPTVRDAIGHLPPPGETGDPLHDLPERRSERVGLLIRLIPKDGGSRTDLPEEFQLPCHQRCDGFKDIFGRMAWGKVAPTLTTGCFNPSRGRFLHPEADRAITMREAAMLQTFPRRYKFPAELGKTALSTLIGNALPPEFVRRHALMVRRYLERTAP